MSAQKSYLPIPEFESSLQHSFKQENCRRSKRPPKLNPNTSFSKLASPSFQVISFRSDGSKAWSHSSQQNNDSYFDKCFVHLAKIGEGSFSEVFKVRSKEDGKLYAIKKSNIPYRSEFYRERSLDEVRYFETFSGYENCVTLYKAWEQNGHLYMQLELCETLESHMKDVKNVTEDFYWSIMLDILLAVKALHDRDLIHLDIKLDNILIDEDGVCKLGDFGLVVDTKKAKNQATEGDSRYIAPEILDGHFSKAADIFSLGITMLELVTNLDLQNNGPLWQDLRDGILPDVCLDLMSTDFQNLIRWMMTPSPTKRPDINRLLLWPRIKAELERRHKLAPVKYLRTCCRKTGRFLWRNVCQLGNFILHIFGSFFLLTSTAVTTPNKRDDSTFSNVCDFSDNDSPSKNLSLFSTSGQYETSMSMEGNIVNSTPVIRHGYRNRSSLLSSSSLNSSDSSINDSLHLTRKKLFAFSEDGSE